MTHVVAVSSPFARAVQQRIPIRAGHSIGALARYGVDPYLFVGLPNLSKKLHRIPRRIISRIWRCTRISTPA